MNTIEEKEKEVADLTARMHSFPNWAAVLDLKDQINALNKQIRKEKKALEPVYIETNDQYILSFENVEDIEIDALIKKGIESLSRGINDHFYDSDELDDDGVDYDAYWLIGDRLFHSVLHYDTRWEGEWSMRCHVVESHTAKETSRKEINDFEITYKDEKSETESQWFEIFNARYEAPKTQEA